MDTPQEMYLRGGKFHWWTYVFITTFPRFSKFSNSINSNELFIVITTFEPTCMITLGEIYALSGKHMTKGEMLMV
jgi:hypothetical protein